MKRLKADTVANTAVASAARSPPSSRRSCRPRCCRARPRCASCRRCCKGRQLFAGKIDGTYGADLRTAIESLREGRGPAGDGARDADDPEAAGRQRRASSRPRAARETTQSDQDLSSVEHFTLAGVSGARRGAAARWRERLGCWSAPPACADAAGGRGGGGTRAVADEQQERRRATAASVCSLKRRPQQHELAVAGLDEAPAPAASLSPAARRSRTSTRRSRASSALLSSIDWFWQTRQRSSCEILRARASSAGSLSISPGSTAWAGERARKRATSAATTQSGDGKRGTGSRPSPG